MPETPCFHKKIRKVPGIFLNLSLNLNLAILKMSCYDKSLKGNLINYRNLFFDFVVRFCHDSNCSCGYLQFAYIK